MLRWAHMSIVTYYTEFASPVGQLLLTATDKGLSGLYVHDKGKTIYPPQGAIENEKFFSGIKKQLEGYFSQKLTTFDVRFDLEGTEFQKKVWGELFKIPYGVVISYKELAKRVGSPKAVRAVGNANGKNPVSIIIPCHRVIASGGGLGGYGWGLDMKRQLLKLEKVGTLST